MLINTDTQDVGRCISIMKYEILLHIELSHVSFFNRVVKFYFSNNDVSLKLSHMRQDSFSRA